MKTIQDFVTDLQFISMLHRILQEWEEGIIMRTSGNVKGSVASLDKFTGFSRINHDCRIHFIRFSLRMTIKVVNHRVLKIESVCYTFMKKLISKCYNENMDIDSVRVRIKLNFLLYQKVN